MNWKFYIIAVTLFFGLCNFGGCSFWGTVADILDEDGGGGGYAGHYYSK